MDQSPSFDAIADATERARWLLAACADGAPLTQTHALARSLVREAAELWPQWWRAELFGPPQREAELPVLAELHHGLRRLRLVCRRGRQLFITPRGRELLADPDALLDVLLEDLGASEPFTQTVAAVVTGRLRDGLLHKNDELVAAAIAEVRRGGWRDGKGNPPTDQDIGWVVSEIEWRGEAYGVVERGGDERGPLQLTLTPAGRLRIGHPSKRGS